MPAIAYWPGTIAPGTTTDETAMTMDLFPTYLSLAGEDLPEDLILDGMHLRSVMLEEMPLPERSLFWRLRRKKAVREGEWKLCAHGNERELYNLSDDRSETEDLSNANPKVLESLEADLFHWEREVGL